jgi:hypothetical protein
VTIVFWVWSIEIRTLAAKDRPSIIDLDHLLSSVEEVSHEGKLLVALPVY